MLVYLERFETSNKIFNTFQYIHGDLPAITAIIFWWALKQLILIAPLVDLKGRQRWGII